MPFAALPLRRGVSGRTGGRVRASGSGFAGGEVDGDERRAHELVEHLVRGQRSVVDAHGDKAARSQPPANTLIARRAICAGWREQTRTPSRGRRHRAMAWMTPWRSGASSPTQRVETIGQLRHRQRSAARRSQLQAQRDPCERAADPAHGRELVRAQRTGRQVHRQPGEEQRTGVGTSTWSGGASAGGTLAGRPGRPVRRQRRAARGWSPGPEPRVRRQQLVTTPPILGSRCSQLSTRSTTCWSAIASPTAVITSSCGSTCTPNAAATAAGTSSMSTIGARSTKYGPTSWRPTTARRSRGRGGSCRSLRPR